MAYEEKYRRRAIEYWREGHSKRQTAAVFKISPTTLQKWKTQLKETGTLSAKKRSGTWRKIDPEKLRSYVQDYPDAYLREISKEFGCSIHAVEKALGRLKISRKKNSNV